MKHLAYVHTRNYSLVETLVTAMRGMLPGPLRSPKETAGPVSIRSRVLVAIGWVIVLVAQAALILLAKELVVLCHGVIDLYLDLARIQLDLTTQYVAATSPK